MILVGLGVAFIALAVVGVIKKPGSVYKYEPEQQNPFQNKRVKFVENASEPENADGVRGHLEAIPTEVENSEYVHKRRVGIYEKYVKRILDIILSGVGLIFLSPVFAVVSIAVWLDDPGAVLFTQKRVGRDKRFFGLHKFRSMRMDTPHDVPTHQLSDPEQYITKVGRVLRRTSLDELPQIWDIWLGNMSVIGPRPALWNQDKLVALRDGYSSSSGGEDAFKIDANSVTPGLTGLAQIRGRDELSLEDKAAIDQEYCKKLSFGLDLRCFIGTVKSVLGAEGVVEGGTGSMEKSRN